MIREIKISELPLVSELVRGAYAEGLIPEYDPAAFEFHWQKLIEAGVGAIFAEGTGPLAGGIGVIVTADLYTGQTLAREAAFFIRPEHRDGSLAHRLLAAYDEWAESKGAIRQFITAHWGPTRGRLEKMYLRKGYSATEVCYGRDVGNEDVLAIERAS